MTDLVSTNGGRLGTTNFLEDFFEDFDRAFRNWPLSQSGSRPQLSGRANTDIIERDDHFELQMDMPGVSKEDVDVFVDENNHLNIRASRSDTVEDEEGDYLKYSKKKRSYSYSMNLGQNVEADDIEAELDSGILRVNLPKREVTEKTNYKKIDIQ